MSQLGREGGGIGLRDKVCEGMICELSSEGNDACL
jgi:hypothetical protein